MKDACKLAFEQYQGEMWENMEGTQQTVWYPIFKRGWVGAIDALTKEVKGKRVQF